MRLLPTESHAVMRFIYLVILLAALVILASLRIFRPTASDAAIMVIIGLAAVLLAFRIAWDKRQELLHVRRVQGLCLHCGYDLRGLDGPEPVCPECGFRHSADSQPPSRPRS